MPSDTDMTGLILLEENDLRFARFTNEDAYTLGQHIRKRFRASQRYSKGRGIAIAIKSLAGHTLFACTVGESGDVTLESWSCLEGMIRTAIQTGHSSYYIDRNLATHGRSPEHIGLKFPDYRLDGGAFPIWLTNATTSPIAIAGEISFAKYNGRPSDSCANIAAYGESSQEDHQLVVKSIRDYLIKMGEEGMDGGSPKSTHRRVASVASMR